MVVSRSGKVTISKVKAHATSKHLELGLISLEQLFGNYIVGELAYLCTLGLLGLLLLTLQVFLLLERSTNPGSWTCG